MHIVLLDVGFMDDTALSRRLATLPASPGVYLFKSRDGRTLYVGKARSLRARVRSYFAPSSSDERAFIQHLRKDLGDISTIVSASETEAALLENQLIKAEQPRYNIKLRDDKEFLSLRLDRSVAWPRVQVVRRPKQDGADYFGPFPSATVARDMSRLAKRHFQLRTCTDREFASRSRPCLQYHIKRCPAPCVLEVAPERYAAEVDLVRKFLGGLDAGLLEKLRTRMAQAAADLDFEEAARLRDQCRALERLDARQSVSGTRDLDLDAVAHFRRDEEAEVALFVVRGGRLIGVHTYSLHRVRVPDTELIANFCREYYGGGAVVPGELLLPATLQLEGDWSAWLSEVAGARIKVVQPKRGEKAQMMRLALDNAAHAFSEKERARQACDDSLRRLGELLGLPHAPRRIECIDVSHFGGDDTVAVVTALEDGELARGRYRSFRLKRVSGGDDYAALYEVLCRRFERSKADPRLWRLPDVLIVDGGKGQLASAQAAARDTGIRVALAGLAKARANVEGEVLEDRLVLEGELEPVSASRARGALRPLQLLRDEAHRAANALREKQSKRRTLESWLDDVDGIGPVAKRKILGKFPTRTAFMQATDEALAPLKLKRSQILALRAPAERD